MARKISTYEHTDKKRINNPPVGLVTPASDPDDQAQQGYAYDPHLDPQLVWAGKAEHTSFEVPTVSLHVHERIDPRTIIEAVQKKTDAAQATQMSLFESAEENPPLYEAIDFYKHAHGWSNRLVAGDSLLVMNSMLVKEGLAGKVQMIYIDPPYGIKYGSNFQPFVNKKNVKDGNDEDLTTEPEQIRAFRDTWELGIHSYLTYLRDRLLLARELLSETGSVFVQISLENVHHVRELLDEVFDHDNFVSIVTYKTTTGARQQNAPKRVADFLIWYAKSVEHVKFNRLFQSQNLDTTIFSHVVDETGTKRIMTEWEKQHPNKLPSTLKPYTTLPLHSKSPGDKTPREINGRLFIIPTGSWRYSAEGLKRLIEKDRIFESKNVFRTISFFDDFPYEEYTTIWNDTSPELQKVFAVQTSPKVIQRCMLMTTDPGDLVFDPTCGSGTTAFVAEQWGRRWITCDTSRVAVTLAKQRLMTEVYDYYQLAKPGEGVRSGFTYKTVPHITLKSIANNEPPEQETLYDQPLLEKSKVRVSGPFTVEAVPAPAVMSVEGVLETSDQPADTSVARSGETLRQADWRDELKRTGIRAKAGQFIRFARLEVLPGCRWLHVDGESLPSEEDSPSIKEGTAYSPQRIVVSFGPEHAPLEQRQVERALEEANTLVPKPKIVVFAAFQFDPEAARAIDETNFPGVTLLKAQMNADLLTEDLKKKQTRNESFWLIGQPDVRVDTIESGEDKGKVVVSVHGFDYYNTRTGQIESGGSDKIAVWLLDPDYDGRSLFPRQVFLPLEKDRDVFTKLAKDLKADIDEDLISAFSGTVSLPFMLGDNKRIAVKIVDDRGIESLKVMEVE